MEKKKSENYSNDIICVSSCYSYGVDFPILIESEQ